MVEIEQAALRALEQDVLALGDLARDVAPGVARVRRELGTGGERILDPARDLAGRRRGAAEVRDQRGELVEVRQIGRASCRERV